MANAALVAVPAASLHVSRPTHWLESRFHFSFAGHYYEQSNRNQYGVLRVLNDDRVIAGEGFGKHPHRDMEIMSYILDGELTHKDSMGSAESLSRGAVQFMSAGTGVQHSEMNKGRETCRFLQVWILPRAPGMKPRYGSRSFTRAQRLNRLLHIAYPDTTAQPEVIEGGPEAIGMGQDVNFFCSELEPGRSVETQIGQNRQVYLINAEGDLEVRVGEEVLILRAGDAVEVNQRSGRDLSVQLTAVNESTAHLLFIEMARDAR